MTARTKFLVVISALAGAACSGSTNGGSGATEEPTDSGVKGDVSLGGGDGASGVDAIGGVDGGVAPDGASGGTDASAGSDATTGEDTTTIDGGGAIDGATTTDAPAGDGATATDSPSSACDPLRPTAWSAMASVLPLTNANVTMAIAHPVWTGSKMLALGLVVPCPLGTPSCTAHPYDDALAYDPVADAWTLVGTRLFEAESGRMAVASLWTGSEWLLFGGYARAMNGRAFDPATGGWSDIPAAPLSERSDYIAVWSTTTREMIVFGGDGNVDGAAYDPSTHGWRAIAPSPASPRWWPNAAWDGTRMIVAFGSRPPGAGGEPPTGTGTYFTDAWAYDPATNAWGEIPTPPAHPRNAEAELTLGASANLGAFWGGTFMTASTPPTATYDYERDGAWWSEASASWSAIPASPLAGTQRVATASWSGAGQMWLWGGVEYVSGATFFDDGAIYDPSSNAWTIMPGGGPSPRDSAIGVWTGCESIVYGGGSFKAGPTPDHPDGKIFKP